MTFAVLLLTGAALGDRFGRRRLLIIGVAVFTAASAASAMAPSIDVLIAARAVQGIGAAIVTPLTVTLIASVTPPQRRGMALGLWGATVGLGAALGPVIGGAVTDAASWQWIFWINVPIGIAVLPSPTASAVGASSPPPAASAWWFLASGAVSRICRPDRPRVGHRLREDAVRRAATARSGCLQDR